MGHVEFKDNSDMDHMVSACRELQVEGTKSKGRGRITWNECVKVDMKWLGLVKDGARNGDKWRSLTTGNHSTLPKCGNEGVILYRLRSRDDTLY